MVILNPEGQEIGRISLFVQERPHEISHPLRVSPEGHIFQLALDDIDNSIDKEKFN